MKTKTHRAALIEGLEQRVLLDASQLTETIVGSTLPASVSDQATLKGIVSVQMSNNSGAAQTFKGSIAVDAAQGALDVAGGNFVILRSGPAAISLKDGQSKVLKVAVNLAKGKLTDGTFHAFGVVTDSNGGSSQSPAGPTLLVRVPDIALAETETFKNLPQSTAASATLKAVDTVKITNNGTDPFSGLLKVSLLASPDDTVAGAKTTTSISKSYTIQPHHTVSAVLKFTSEAGLDPDVYRLLSAAMEPDGTVTSSNPASALTFTITGSGAPLFVPTISSATPVYATDSSHPSSQHITQLDLSMSIKNNGAVSIGADQFNLFASTKPTFDSAAIQETSQPVNLTLDEYPGSNQPFQIDINIPDAGPHNGTTVNYYIFVQVTDTSGGVSMASFATPIIFAGPVGGSGSV